jgi:hypothetical protein
MSLLISGDLRLAKGQPVPNDPNFAFNSLLLHGNGTNGSTVITDSSGSPKTVTAVGNAQISTAIADPFGNASAGVILLDGTGDYLTIPIMPIIGSLEDFTAEAWVYPTVRDNSGYSIVFAPLTAAAPDIQLAYDQTTEGSIFFYFGGSAGSPSGTAVTRNAWHHLAWVRTSGTCMAFVNGTRLVNAAVSNTVSAAIRTVGRYASGGFEVNGYMSDIRITQGVARYTTASFTPPTAPFPDF